MQNERLNFFGNLKKLFLVSLLKKKKINRTSIAF